MPGAPRSSPEAGFTLIEVMVSSLILVVGLLGLLLAFNGANHANTTTLRQQVATTQAEQAMEKLKGTTYASLWLTSTPSHAADGNTTGDTSGVPTNPTYWIGSTPNTGKLRVVADFGNESSATLTGVSSGYEPLVTSGSGAGFSPGPTSFTVGSVTGNIYRFITTVSEPCATGSVVNGKRVTVAVTLNAVTGAGVNKPVWLSSVVPNPSPTACL